jgi:hypothetical protein
MTRILLPCTRIEKSGPSTSDAFVQRDSFPPRQPLLASRARAMLLHFAEVVDAFGQTRKADPDGS